MTQYYRAFDLGPQAHILQIIEGLDYGLDQIIALDADRAREIVELLDWPREPGLRVLASRLDPSSASIIHKDWDRDTEQALHWAINVPVANCESTFMEWFTGGTTSMPMPPVKDSGIFRGYEQVINPGDAQLAGSSKGCVSAYVASNLNWHRVVNRSRQVSWCISVRYYPLSFMPFKQALAIAPWLARITG